MSSNEGNSPIEFFGSPFIIEENKEFQCIHGGTKKISKAREAETKASRELSVSILYDLKNNITVQALLTNYDSIILFL